MGAGGYDSTKLLKPASGLRGFDLSSLIPCTFTHLSLTHSHARTYPSIDPSSLHHGLVKGKELLKISHGVVGCNH
jgi:hypothetical protein